MVLSPKQQEIQDREHRILKIARTHLLSDGYHGFGLEGIASELGVSRGTIYKHFSCKEDVILALLLETLELRKGWIQRAAACRGTTRNRMMAILVAAELFARLRPDHYRIEEIAGSGTVWEKADADRKGQASHLNTQVSGILSGIVREAVVQDDLKLPSEMSPEDIVLGIWALVEGGFALFSRAGRLWQPLPKGAGRILRFSFWQLLDGFGWKPIETREKHELTTENVLKELFSAELKQLKQEW